MDPPQPDQGAGGPGQQQQPPAAAQEAAAQPLVAVPAAEPEPQQPAGEQDYSEADSQGSEDDWDEEEAGVPDSLLQLEQRQVLGGIEAAARGIQSPFSVGGSLGRLPVALAVAQPPPTASTAPASAAPASQPAVAVRFPEGGEEALQALEKLCQPASFGKGTEAGACGESGGEGRASPVLPGFRALWTAHRIPRAMHATALLAPAMPCRALPCPALPCHALHCTALLSQVFCHSLFSCCSAG